MHCTMISISPSLVHNISLPSPSSAAPRTRLRPSFISNTATAYKETASNHQLMASSSLYDVLGIPIAATKQEIKSAYRRLARTCHPDLGALDRKDTLADEFIKIHSAYSTLSDPEKRAAYDRKMLRRSRPLNVSYSGYRCRNWETDQCW